MTTTYSAHGKLLISGEYFVLDGALSLACPTHFGQHLQVQQRLTDDQLLTWESLDEKNQCWFKAKFNLPDFRLMHSNEPAVAQRLLDILQVSRQLNPDFLQHSTSHKVTSLLEFPRAWGLGTSSTLIYNMAQWAQVDPYQLLDKTFGGSGYDIACAAADGPVFYQRLSSETIIQRVDFQPSFTDQLYFVYLGKKQNSREGIAHYRKQVSQQPQLIDQVSKLTKNLSQAKDLTTFAALLKEHEQLLAIQLKMTPVQSLYFSDFWGVVKSLGAWGGDFVLVTSDRPVEETKAYFEQKGMDIFVKYNDMVLHRSSSKFVEES